MFASAPSTLRHVAFALCLGLLAIGTSLAGAQAQSDPLPSWNEGAAKKSITDFVAKVTAQGGAEFVPPTERIAVFDNDGTLWCEQPIYFQAAFALDRVKAMALDHPEWKNRQPFKAFLSGDRKALAAQGEKALLKLVAATHSGMTTDEFAKSVADWLATDYYATSPKTDPSGPATGTIKVEKGGWWGSNEFVARSAYRHYEDPPTYGDKHIGFRVASQ